MINPLIVDILVRRILDGGINPKTGDPMRLTDVATAYQESVENELLIRTGAI